MKYKFAPLALLLTLVLTLSALAGCQSANTQDSSQTVLQAETASETDAGEPLRVVTTIFPPYDFVREIAGDHVELTMLLSPGAESHSYDPTPQDMITIQNSDVFLYVGGDSDIWVDRILESVDTGGMTILPMLAMVDAVEEELVEGMEHGHDEDDDHDHEDSGHQEAHRELDEHVWTSPQNAIAITAKISEVLCGLDPKNQEVYRSRTDAYLNELSALNDAFLALRGETVRSTVIFGDRFPFRYLADAYGLSYYAAFLGCSTETEASAATVAFLIDKVKEEEIPVVFHIELSNEKMADAISEATGAKKLLLHSCHNVSRDDFQAGATYLQLMEQNLAHLKEALA